jgi:hypothetical protein
MGASNTTPTAQIINETRNQHDADLKRTYLARTGNSTSSSATVVVTQGKQKTSKISSNLTFLSKVRILTTYQKQH